MRASQGRDAGVRAVHPEMPERYRAVGQPVFIPGSMGTASYVLVGTDEALGLSFGSAATAPGAA